MTFSMALAAPGLFIKGIISGMAALFAGVSIFILEGLTNWGQAAINSFSVVGAAFLAFAAVWLKVRWDRYKYEASRAVKSQVINATTSLERERLVDQRSNALFEDLEQFYALRERESQAIIGLLKETSANTRADLEQVIASQKELIVQQAAMLAALQSAATK